MKAMCTALMCLLVAAAQAQPASKDGGSPVFRAVAPVVLTSNEGLQRLTLPLPVVLASRSAGYADVRITSPDGQTLPIAWAQAQPTLAPAQRTVAVPRFAWPNRSAGASAAQGDETRIRIDTLGAVVEVHNSKGKATAPPPSGESLRWLLDVSQGRQPTEQIERVLLNWPARPEGLSAQVQVEASDDAVNWRSVTTAALLELPGASSSTVNLKHIAWPAGVASPRYLRLSFDAPLSLSSSEVRWTHGPTQAPKPSEVFEFVQQAPQTPQTPSNELVWALDLGGRLPVAQIEVLGNEPNTVSALRLEQRDDPAQPWQPVTSFVAWRLQRQGVEQRSPAVDVPATPARYWRLVSDGRTSKPGGAALKVKLSWVAPQLVFAATSAQGLELRVGLDKAVAAALPLSTLMPGYEAGAEYKLPAATVGALAAVPWREPTLLDQLSSPSPQQRKQWLLWAVLAVAVVGLGVLAMRLAGDVKGGGTK
jgi:Protein of unknown function (DUF3999)